jgi:hypothetical protein
MRHKKVQATGLSCAETLCIKNPGNRSLLVMAHRQLLFVHHVIN